MYDVAIVGAGPAGLAASIEAAKCGCDVLVLDSNLKPGGQLTKQIHKFFGSREHRAGTRGIDIAQALYKEALHAGVEFWFDSSVLCIFPSKKLCISRGILARKPHGTTVKASKIILATGASENAIGFPGWTLPGVMGAGAAQTMINVERVLPGRKILMVGSGNVGLIVSYQLMQAGAEVVALVEGLSEVGGYGVHAAKITRAGVPILTSHTVTRALGKMEVVGAEIAEVDSSWSVLARTKRQLDIDTICIATGLRPLAKLALMVGCKMAHEPILGGWVPYHDARMQTSIPDILVAGDVSGVEEASTALEEGRLAGLSVAEALGKIGSTEVKEEGERIRERLTSLRIGPFGLSRQYAKEHICKAGEARCLAI